MFNSQRLIVNAKFLHLGGVKIGVILPLMNTELIVNV